MPAVPTSSSREGFLLRFNSWSLWPRWSES